MNIKTNTMQKIVIDWNITGSLMNNKYNLHLTLTDGTQKTITDTLSELTKIVKTL
jgi:hypothetical protein